MLNVIGPKFAFVAGMLMNGVCGVTAGFLDQIPSGPCFVIYSILIRVISAVGNAGVITSSFTFIAIDFKDYIATIFSVTRLMMNIGQLIGPALGGILFEMGGYTLPFVILGAAQVLVALICFFSLSDYEDAEDKKNQKGDTKLSITGMLVIPGMWVAFGSFLVSTLANGFISVTLEPQVLRQFNLEPFYMGLLFGLKDGVNSVFSLLWGWWCDKKPLVKPCVVISSLTVCLALAVLAPFPGLTYDRTLWLTSGGLVLLGIGVGGQQLAGVIDALHEAVDAGYPNDPATQGVVAGMWSSIGGLGRFAARSGCGILVDNIGFQWSSVVIIAFHALLAQYTVSYMLLKKKKVFFGYFTKRKVTSKVLHQSTEFNKTLSLLA